MIDVALYVSTELNETAAPVLARQQPKPFCGMEGEINHKPNANKPLGHVSQPWWNRRIITFEDTCSFCWDAGGSWSERDDEDTSGGLEKELLVVPGVWRVSGVVWSLTTKLHSGARRSGTTWLEALLLLDMIWDKDMWLSGTIGLCFNVKKIHWVLQYFVQDSWILIFF